MKATNFLKTILMLLFVISGCKQEPDPKPLPEQGYPTTYKPLNQAEFSLRNKAFQKINIYNGLHLNEYGFVTGEISIGENDSITKDFVLAVIDTLIERYQLFMGIPPSISVNTEREILIDAFYIVPNGNVTIDRYFNDLGEIITNGYLSNSEIAGIQYKFYLNQNLVENERFSGPKIYIDFQNKERVIQISGNWFPKAFIPQSQIYSENEVIVSAWREILKRTGIDLWETKYNFKTMRTLMQKAVNNNIEIRECWSVYVPVNDNLVCYVYIDTQTGEILKYYQRDWLYM